MAGAPQAPIILLDGLAYLESPRWHEGRLWFAHWGTGEIVAVDLDGHSEVTGHGPAGLGWSIDWLPDGRLLVTGQELLRREPDGSMVRHAALSGLADGWNEIVVDGRHNIYLNSIRFHFLAGAAPTSGIIALITPDGTAAHRARPGDLRRHARRAGPQDAVPAGGRVARHCAGERGACRPDRAGAGQPGTGTRCR